MSSNFNSFQPYNASQGKFSETIAISADDRLEEIQVDLRALNCQYEGDQYQPWDWPDLNLEGFKEVRMYVKMYQQTELHATIIGVPVAPLGDGIVLFRFPGSAFGRVEGKYVGLVEVEYKGSDVSGNKIVTSRNYIPFEVREEFFCDPFDPDFGECAPTGTSGDVKRNFKRPVAGGCV